MGFDILSSETYLDKKLLLEASAGTGKTFTIEHLFIRLLVEKKIPFSSLLVLTFTKAATRELKMRIRENIRTILEKLHKKEELPPYLSGMKDRKEAIEILEAALGSFEQAKIFTIHGFCQNILQTNASLTPHGLFSPPEEGEERVLSFVKESLLDYYRITSFELQHTLRNNRQNLDLFLQQILSYIPGDGLESFVELCQELYELFCAEKIELEGEIFPLALNYKTATFDKETLEEEFSLLEGLSYRLAEDSFREKIELSLQVGSFPSFFSSSNTKVKEKTKLTYRMEWFLHKALPIFAKMIDPSRIIGIISTEFQEKIYSFCLKEDIITPDNLLTRVNKSLLYPEFVEAIQKEIKVAIIDEFQDTDPVQWNILSTLFHTQDHYLYLVGDPKQSIYGFRSADIYTYLQAKESIQNSAALDCNFRSSLSLIEALNALYQGQSFSLPKIGKELVYHPVKAAKEAVEEFPPIEFFIGKTEAKKNALRQEEIRLFYPFMAREILSMSEKEREGSVILVKDKNQAKEIQRYLLSMGILSKWSRKKKLGDTLALKAFQDLLNAVFFPFDDSYLRKTLVGPYFSFPWDCVADEISPSYRIPFYLLREKLEKGLPVFLSEFLSLTIDKKSVLEEMMNFEMLYEETIEVASILSRESINPFSLQQLFHLLEEKESSSFSSVENAVQIMTMHSSKGLEFETVFAIGLLARSSGKESSFRSDSEIDAEKQRQLYVALTRAKKKLYIPVLISEKERSLPVAKASPIELFLSRALHKKNYEKICYEELIFYLQSFDPKRITYQELPVEVEKKEMIFLEKEMIRPKHKTIDQPSIPLLSFSSTQEEYEEIPFGQETKDPRGAQFGTFLHELLASLLSSDKNEEESLQWIRKVIEGSPYSSYIEMITEMVISAIFSPLTGGITLMSLPLEDRHPEIEFHFLSSKGAIWKGTIDLLFFHEGKYYILDWKSNYLGEDSSAYSEPSVQIAMEKGDYYRQGTIYSEAVRRYLQENNLDREIHFGGIIYYFLRGASFKNGIYHFFPDREIEI